jgi:transcriptional antiterminator NusG
MSGESVPARAESTNGAAPPEDDSMRAPVNETVEPELSPVPENVPDPRAHGESQTDSARDNDLDESLDDETDNDLENEVEVFESDESAAAMPLEDVSGELGDMPEKRWYILKVQSNRENSICDALRRQVAIRGLEGYFGDVLVPTEDVAEFKNGKRRVVKRKLYPGYIVVNMSLTDETWFVVRETPGIGDFTGAAGKPAPMLDEEIQPILKLMYPDDEAVEVVKTAIPFKPSDRVRIKEGTFENFEGEVESIDEANGRVTVIINIFGRSTPVELEHWQIEMV